MDQMEVTVYARAFCTRTWRVKRLLRRKGYYFSVVDGAQYESSWCPLGSSIGSKTLPQVFVAGRLVGGFDEITALDRSGILDRLVRGEV